MKNTVRIIRQIEAPAGWLWEIISLVGGVDQWMPTVHDCRMEGRGVGAHRLCKVDGGWVREVVEVIEHTEKRFEYAVIGAPMMPIKKFRGMMQVIDVDGVRSLLVWRGEFEVTEGDEREVCEMIKGYFHLGVEGLARHWMEMVRAVA